MNEKTSEEKLREELDEKTSEEKLRAELERDSLIEDNPRSPSEDKSKPSRLRGVRRRISSGADKSVGQQVDSFIDDFEKKIEESLSGRNVKTQPSSPKQEKPRSNMKTQTEVESVSMNEEHEDTEQNLTVNTVEEIPQIIPEAVHEPEHEDIPQVIPEIESEIEPEIEPDDVTEESESLPEIEPEPEKEPEEANEPEHEDELPDIPLIDSDEDEELPDIPVISADEVDEPDDGEELEEFENILVLDDNEGEPESEDEEPEEQIENEEPESETETTEDISSPADIVLNVDSDLPQIVEEPEEEPDPEAESSPVSVTMPETIKTAEDKLMADIAEAFTGNPLTLESKEAPEPYRLPEDFFTSQNNDSNAEQSAEDKLKANIAQAISESPIGIAQQQAMQDLEKDLSPFDDISSLSELADIASPGVTEPEEAELESESEPQAEPEPELESEPDEEKHEEDEEFLPDFTDEPQDINTDPEEIHDMPEAEPENENADEETDENDDSQPFELDDEPVVEIEETPEFENLPLSEPEPEPEPEPENESESDESEVEPLTAQQRLEQEIAQFTQDAPANENDKDTQQEEVSPENDMPDNLLDGTENDIAPQDDEEIGDDWDINSLGIVSEATSIPDDGPEPEHEEHEPELDPSFMTGPTEETHKEKTMGLREKLAAKKNGEAPKDSSPASSKKTSSSSSGGGILIPILLFLLLIVGALTLWQLFSLPDRLASVIAMSSNGVSGVFEPLSHAESNSSYDYTIDFILDNNIVERMSQRGKDGWQVVGSRRTQDSTTGQYGYEIIFMKRISGR